MSTADGCACSSPTSRSTSARSWLIPPRSGAPVPSRGTLSVHPMPNAHRIARRFDSRGYDLCVTDLETLTAGDFEPLVHERFRFTSEATMPFDVELIDVSETGAHGSSRSQFSLVFRG